MPIALPAVYFDQRMIAQKSCFTVHGSILSPLKEILVAEKADLRQCLIEYEVTENRAQQTQILRDLAYLGISASTVYPDLDHLALDIRNDIE